MKKQVTLKFILIIFSFLLLHINKSIAQTPVSVVIGNTTGVGGPNYGPVNTGGALDIVYSRNAHLYTAAELGIPSGAKIIKLEWLKKDGGAVPPPHEFNIWLKNTTSTSFPATPQWNSLVNGASQTYANTTFSILQANNTYVDAPFNVPGNDSFTYTGDNLQILTDWHELGPGGVVNFYYQTSTGKGVGMRSSIPPSGTSFLQTVSMGNARPTIRITYIPSSPCSGLPVTGAAISYVPTACYGVPFTLSVQNPIAASGVSYHWQRANDSLFLTGFSALGNTATLVTTQTTASYYRCLVTCTSSGSSYVTPFVYVPMSLFYHCYCANAPMVPTAEDIFNFTFGSLNNSSLCNDTALGNGSMPSQYSNYQYILPPIVAKLSSVPYSIQVGDCSGSSFYYLNRTVIFIDYNHDGIFDASEMADTSNGVSIGPNIVSGNIMIPSNALDGLTGLRVIVSEQSAPFNISTIQCFGIGVPYVWGETEDYLINIITPLPCAGIPSPGNTMASANPVCSGSTVNLSLQFPPLSTGNTFQWFRNNNPIAGATNNIYTTTISATDSFYCSVTCTNSGLSAPSSTVVFGLISFLNCYGSSAAQMDPDEDIYEVTVNGASTNPLYANANSCLPFGPPAPGPGSVNGQYSNFMTLGNFTSMVQGATVPFEVRVNDCDGAPYYVNGVGIWIDYNHNGSFSDPGEAVFIEPTTTIATGPSPAGDKVVSGTFIVPPIALTGQTAMRVAVIEGIAGQNLLLSPCWIYPFGETEDYLINIHSAGPYDPALIAISAPIDNTCTGANETISATVCNYGSSPINLALNPFYITYIVQGPSGTATYIDTLNTGIMLPLAAAYSTSVVTHVDMFAGGNYSINAIVTCPGLSNNFPNNNLLTNAITMHNYRPSPGLPYTICQNAGIPLGQGLDISGCPAPVLDTLTLTFDISLCIDNVGATSAGNTPNAHCADQYACTFATTTIPILPPGATFTQDAVLTITNLSTNSPAGSANPSLNTEVRMNLFKNNPIGANLLSAAGNGATTLSGIPTSYTYQRTISPTELTSIFSTIPTGGALNIGYWESFQQSINLPDIMIDAAGNTSVATLQIFYQNVAPVAVWYEVPTSGTSLNSLSPFNPLAIPNAVVNNTNTPGTFTFYAACSADSSCRVPVDLVINQTPPVFQDTLLMCEYTSNSNNAIFDLTTMNGSVSGNNPSASVTYFSDQGLFIPILNPTTYSSSTNFIYSNVFDVSTGCSSSDSIYLEVTDLPQFSQSNYIGFTCTPNSIDISSLISVFNQSPIDTLYFNDPSYTSSYVNPHVISSMDTVYMIVKTTNSVACSDSAVAYIHVNQSSSSYQTLSALCFYTWPVNGVTYTSSGVYTSYSVNAVGCTQSDTLNVTLNCLTMATLNLTCFIEGYWNGMNAMLPVLANQNQPTTVAACDTIDVELRDQNSPYGLVSSTRTVLYQDGTAICHFTLPTPAGNYYVAVKHRNALMTWSANPLVISAIPTSYDFTLSSAQAFGNNMIEVAPAVWAFYSGDVVVDENIDLLDVTLVEGDINNFNFGYLATDINGDGNVDLLDTPLLESNINNFIFSNHP